MGAQHSCAAGRCGCGVGPLNMDILCGSDRVPGRQPPSEQTRGRGLNAGSTEGCEASEAEAEADEAQRELEAAVLALRVV